MSQTVQRVSLPERVPPPVWARILNFADSETDARVGSACKAFNRALEILKGQVCMQLLMPPDMQVVAGQDDTAPRRLQTKYDETIPAHMDWLQRGHHRWILGVNEATSLQDKIAQLKDSILAVQNPASRNMRSARLCAALTRWEGERQAAINYMDARGLMLAHDRDNPLPALYQSLARIILQENSVDRFARATAVLNADNNPSYNSERLTAFHTSQRDAARISPVSRRAFAALPQHSFSLVRFLHAEEIATHAELQIGNTLLSIGEQIEMISPLEELPPRPRTPAAWRPWFREERNTPHINALMHLTLASSNTLPEELWQCRNLHFLALCGRGTEDDLADLPPQAANFTNLTELDLSGNSNLRRVPPVVAQLRNLQTLRLVRTQVGELPLFLTTLRSLRYLDVVNSPIRTLPDPVYRHIEWIGYSRETLEQIPFRLQFQERYGLRLPTLNWGGFEYVVYALCAIPVFIYNAILMNIIEPLVTWDRDRRGLPRHVPAH